MNYSFSLYLDKKILKYLISLCDILFMRFMNKFVAGFPLPYLKLVVICRVTQSLYFSIIEVGIQTLRARGIALLHASKQ